MIKHIYEDDPYKATLYDEAIWVWSAEHKNDPAHVARIRELVKKVKGQPYDEAVAKSKTMPDNFLDHVKSCERCISLLRNHINECAPANTLLEYVEK